jgi:glycosyltransferase involved in cell wall biosynthesis
MKPSPRLTIGMPVYNAERYLGAAIESLLAQTFTDFELLIADNASTDSTQRISEEYAARDSRVRYMRHERNMGAGWNHNFLLAQAHSEFFKWAAGDDLHAPRFLEACVEALDADPQAVLGHPLTRMIDPEGNFIEESLDVEVDTASPVVSKRFADLVQKYHQCYPIFGIIRRSVLAKTGGQPNCVHGDGILLAHLALYGHFHTVREPLFFNRRHDAQSSRTPPTRLQTRRFRLTTKVNGLPAAEWWDPSKKRKLTFPQWRILTEYQRCVRTTPLAPANRAACFRALAQWVVRDRRRYVKDIVIAGDQILDNLFTRWEPSAAGEQPGTSSAGKQ